MNNHYIPQLLLRPFSENGRVNLYQFSSKQFQTKKTQRVFAEKDLFDEELEKQLAVKLEGIFGDLLNHKLLRGDEISLDRRENMLLRKFVMILFLRSPLANMSWDEMIQKTDMADSPEMEMHDFMMHEPWYRYIFEKYIKFPRNYITDLKQALEFETVEDVLKHEDDISIQLYCAASAALLGTCTFWDCSQSALEFILPKLQGINLLDTRGNYYKFQVLAKKQQELLQREVSCLVSKEVDRLLYGSLMYCQNYTMVPISPTRVLIYFSPYFRAFFPMYDPTGSEIYYPPLLTPEQFDKHFYDKTRMELFEPCRNFFNRYYTYKVKPLTVTETLEMNAILLNMETDTFVFHDFNRIRDSFWYYHYKMVFHHKRKHDFSTLI